MDKPCGRSAAGAMIGVATAMRLIWHFSIVDNAAYNSAWLCPLIGFIFFLPIGYAIKALSQETCGCAFNAPFLSEKAPLGRIIASVSFMLLSIDTAQNVLLLSHTANIMALGEVPIWLVSIAFALLAFICAFLGMQAEGRSAMIWLRIMIPLLAVMVIVQFGSYRPEWLTPIFGGGFKAIFSGGLRSAAYISCYRFRG